MEESEDEPKFDTEELKKYYSDDEDFEGGDEEKQDEEEEVVLGSKVINEDFIKKDLESLK